MVNYRTTSLYLFAFFLFLPYIRNMSRDLKATLSHLEAITDRLELAVVMNALAQRMLALEETEIPEDVKAYIRADDKLYQAGKLATRSLDEVIQNATAKL